MARNLQAKLPSTDSLKVYDINAESVERFMNDIKELSGGATVTKASTVREAAEDSVSLLILFLAFFLYDEFVLSMI